MQKIAILLFCLSTSRIWAADLLLYDGFDYTAGSSLVENTDKSTDPHPGQHNVAYNLDWRYAGTGGTSTNAPGVLAGSLSLTGLPASVGNSVSFDRAAGANGGSAKINISPATKSGTLYWSGLVRVNDVTNLSSGPAGALVGGFNETAGPSGAVASGGGLLLLQKDSASNNYFIGTSITTNNSDRIFATTVPLAPGDTEFVVVAYQIVAGAANDVVNMWINPSSSSYGAAEGSLPTPTILDQNTPVGSEISAANGIASFFLRNISAESNSMQFDELRIGTTWASVTSTSAAASVPGDYNGNGVVDAADYVLWRAGGPLQSEVDAAGTVNQADYTAWRARFGNTSGSGSGLGSANVPEPVSLLFAFLASVMIGSVARSRRSFRFNFDDCVV